MLHRTYRNGRTMQDTRECKTAIGQPLSSSGKVHLKRKAGGQSEDFDALLADDARRAKLKICRSKGEKRSGDIFLGNVMPVSKMPKLGPILSQRFGGTSSACSS